MILLKIKNKFDPSLIISTTQHKKWNDGHLPYLLLILIILTIYYRIPGFDFINFDDPHYITNNQIVQLGITTRGIKLAFSTYHANNWHPLTWISHMLDCQFFDLNPGMHHLSSLLLHIVNSVLLMFIFYKMTNATWKSFWVAFLFAVHPMHVESVAWISERKDVLSAFFWIVTLLSYIRYAKRPGYRRYAVIFLFFAFGLLSKPMVVTLPFVLLLLDFWPLERFKFIQYKSVKQTKQFPYRAGTTLIIEKIPLLCLALITSCITIYAQEYAIKSIGTYPIYLRLGNAIISYVNYIIKMIFPLNLAIFYPYPKAIAAWKILCAGLLLSSITFLIIKSALKAPYFLTGWFWFLGTLIPVIGLVQVGSQSMADRYTYLPFIGLFIMLVWGLDEFFSKKYSKKIIYPLYVIMATSFIFTAYFQTLHWKNSQTLFKHAIKVVDNNWLAFNNLGVELGNKGETINAENCFRKAILHNPSYFEAYNNLGILLARKGKVESAENCFRKAILHNPSYIEAYKNLGTLFALRNKFDEAAFYFQKALHFDPENNSTKKLLHNALEDIKRQRESF